MGPGFNRGSGGGRNLAELRGACSHRKRVGSGEVSDRVGDRGGVGMGLGHVAGYRQGGWLPPRRVGRGGCEIGMLMGGEWAWITPPLSILPLLMVLCLCPRPRESFPFPSFPSGNRKPIFPPQPRRFYRSQSGITGCSRRAQRRALSPDALKRSDIPLSYPLPMRSASLWRSSRSAPRDPRGAAATSRVGGIQPRVPTPCPSTDDTSPRPHAADAPPPPDAAAETRTPSPSAPKRRGPDVPKAAIAGDCARCVRVAPNSN